MNVASSGTQPSLDYQLDIEDPVCVREIDVELLPDYERLKHDLNLELQAHNDGQSGSPAFNGEESTDVERRIYDKALQKIESLYAFAANELRQVTNAIGTANSPLDLGNKQLEADALLRNSLLETSSQRQAGQDLASAEQRLKYFVARNHLTRPPHYQESPLLFAASLLLLTVLESLANSYIFKDVNESGLSGGFLIAMSISLINVTLGVIGGGVGWRLLGHIHPLARIVGGFVTLTVTATAVAGNIFIAHFRQLAEDLVRSMLASGSASELSATTQRVLEVGFLKALSPNVLPHMKEVGWLHLQSFWSWLLLGVGLFVFLCACCKSWNDLERQWQYRRLDLRRVRAEDKLESECVSLMEHTLTRLDEYLEAGRALLREAEARCRKIEEAADRAEQRVADVESMVVGWAHVAKRLLKFYRDESQKTRTIRTPDRIAYPTVEHFHRSLEKSEYNLGSSDSIDRLLTAIRKTRDLQRARRRADRETFVRFERFVSGRKASVPTKIRELRRTTRNRAQESLANRHGASRASEQSVADFFQSAGCAIRVEGRQVTVTRATPSLNIYVPFVVHLALNHAPDRKAIEALVKQAKSSQPQKESLACLVYQEPPDTLARTELAAVRTQHQVSILPLDLNAMQRSVIERPEECSAMLDAAWKCYGTGKKLFASKLAVIDSLMFFGHERLLGELRDRIVEGHPVGLFGVRKSGKTSALNQLATMLQGYVVTKQDMQKDQGERFGARILREAILTFAKQCKRTPRTNIDPHMSAAEAGPIFSEELIDLAAHVVPSGNRLPFVLMLDEMDRIMPLPRDTLEKANEFNAFIGVLRALSQNDRMLTYVLADLHSDCNSKSSWPQPGAATNPIFSSLLERYVQPFTEAETFDMLNGIGGLMEIEFDISLSREIHRLSGGYPLVSRQLANLIVSHRTDQKLLQRDEENDYLLDNAFNADPFFQKYCSESFLEDFERKDEPATGHILRCLACSDRSVTMEALIRRFDGEVLESQMRAAALTLQQYGLVRVRREGTTHSLTIAPALLHRLVRMTVPNTQRERWRL